jgi:hypothetical protein
LAQKEYKCVRKKKDEAESSLDFWRLQKIIVETEFGNVPTTTKNGYNPNMLPSSGKKILPPQLLSWL